MKMHSTIEWSDSVVCPEPERALLVYTFNHKFMTLKGTKLKGLNYKSDWEWYVSKYAIVAWAYQDEIKVI